MKSTMLLVVAILHFLQLSLAAIASTRIQDGITTPFPNQHSAPTERDLRRDLFRDYDKLVRPARSPDNAVKSQIALSPISIKVDEENQVIIVDSWLRMQWQDDYLTWDPASYSNISVLQLPSSEVWKPDISVYSTTSETSLFPTSPTQVLVYKNGMVMWIPMFTINSRCSMAKNKEKTSLKCDINMGSWTYSGFLLDIQLFNTGVDLTDFQDLDSKWKLVDMKASSMNKYYPCCKEPYPVVFFNATFGRRQSTLSLDNETRPEEMLTKLV